MFSKGPFGSVSDGGFYIAAFVKDGWDFGKLLSTSVDIINNPGCIPLLSFFFSLFCSLGDGTQDLVHARQMLYI